MPRPVSLAIMERALGARPETGQSIDLPIDLAVIGGAAGPETIQLVTEQGMAPWDPSKVILTFDFPAPGVELRVPRSRSICRDFAARHHLRNVYDLNLGIGAQVILELALAGPGQIVVGSGRCLHQVGAAAALSFNAEPGVLARSLATGHLTMKTPPVAQVHFEGSAPEGFSAFDLGLAAVRALESLSGDTIVEFTGRPVEILSMDGRITLVDLGAERFRAGLIAADQVTAAFLAERSPRSRAGAQPPAGEYATQVTVPLHGMEPMIQGPGPGGPVRPISELAGKKIHSAFLGSCAAGRYPDLMVAATMLKRGRKIHPDVRFTLAPATLEVARKCLHAGLFETFFQVGAMLGVPGSSPGMAGGGALFGEGEVILSTAPYASPMTDAGRGPEIYRASPATVAASALAGEIRSPANL
jgi:3-isopropylmalate/(R)-2-methylmalate dehydratase large subunit